MPRGAGGLFVFDSCIFAAYLQSMTIEFGYDKKQVIEALRYHFLSRPEIKILVILINVFAITSATLFYFKKIQAVSFLVFSLLWFILMLIIWRVLPGTIYKRSATFKDTFTMIFRNEELTLQTNRGERSWAWSNISHYVETPHFFHLYFDARSFFLVPKDAMHGEADTVNIRAFINQRVKRK